MSIIKLENLLSTLKVNDNKSGKISVFRSEKTDCIQKPSPLNRKDFFKISFIEQGEGILGYAGEQIKINKPTLTFLNPSIPYSWEPTTQTQKGFFCLFDKDFVSEFSFAFLDNNTKFSNHLLYFPNDLEIKVLLNVFENMEIEATEYLFQNKTNLADYLRIILRFFSSQNQVKSNYNSNANGRIMSGFINLLEKQFPITDASQTVHLKTPNDFAFHLNIDVNHLNKMLKNATGFSTTELIASRLMKEAKSLLEFTKWDIKEISFCLGFEHQSNFNLFFKKHQSQSPKEYRNKLFF